MKTFLCLAVVLLVLGFGVSANAGTFKHHGHKSVAHAGRHHMHHKALTAKVHHHRHA